MSQEAQDAGIGDRDDPRGDYDGLVDVGGPSQTRVLSDATITKLAVGPYNNNAYLLRCRRTGAALLIDAAADPERILDLLGDIDDLQVLTSHAHADHWQALESVVAATGARTLAGRFDAPEIPVPTDRPLDDGDQVEVGDLRLRAIHLQGHTPGSIVTVFEDSSGTAHVFTGDCLFPGGVGKTWDDPQRFASLYDGVVRELFDSLNDDAWVYPGHGADTTIGTERPHLAEWRDRGW